MTTKQKSINADVVKLVTMDPETGLWCLICERFFQAKEMFSDNHSNKCPTKKCKGVGYKKDIFQWDAWAGVGAERLQNWPTTIEELTSGQKCKLTE